MSCVGRHPLPPGNCTSAPGPQAPPTTDSAPHSPPPHLSCWGSQPLTSRDTLPRNQVLRDSGLEMSSASSPPKNTGLGNLSVLTPPLLEAQVPSPLSSQVSWALFSYILKIQVFRSPRLGTQMPRPSPPILECWPQFPRGPGAAPEQGQVTGCASRLPATPGFCLLPGPPLGTGAWPRSPRAA